MYLDGKPGQRPNCPSLAAKEVLEGVRSTPGVHKIAEIEAKVLPSRSLMLCMSVT